MLSDAVLSVFDLIIIIGTIQGIVSAFILFTAENNKRSNHLLAWCVVTLTLSLLKILLHMQDWWEIRWITFLPLSIELFPSVLFYLYTISLLIHEDQKIKGFWLFLIPALVFEAIDIFVYFSCSHLSDPAQRFSCSELYHYNLINQIEDLISVGFMLLFVFLSFKKILDYRDQLLSYAEDKYAGHLTGFLWIMFTLIIIVLVSSVVIIGSKLIPAFQDNFWCEQLYHILLALFLYGFSFYTIRQAQLPSLAIFKPENNQNQEMNDVELKNIFQLLEKYMENEKPYLQPEMSLPILANQIGYKSYIISRAIKQEKSQSFRDYLNGLRLESYLEKSNNPQFDHLTILGKALESGFNSEASFYRIFKKKMGVSPKAYHS